MSAHADLILTLKQLVAYAEDPGNHSTWLYDYFDTAIEQIVHLREIAKVDFRREAQSFKPAEAVVQVAEEAPKEVEHVAHAHVHKTKKTQAKAVAVTSDEPVETTEVSPEAPAE